MYLLRASMGVRFISSSVGRATPVNINAMTSSKSSIGGGSILHNFGTGVGNMIALAHIFQPPFKTCTIQRFDRTRDTNSLSTNVRSDNSLGTFPTQSPLAKAMGGITFFSRKLIHS